MPHRTERRYNTYEINVAISCMFEEHSFARKYRASVRKSILYYLKNPQGYTQITYRGFPVISDDDGDAYFFTKPSK